MRESTRSRSTWGQAVAAGLLLVGMACCRAAPDLDEPFPVERSKRIFATLDFEFLVALPLGVDSDEIFAYTLIRVPEEALGEGVRLTGYDFRAWADENSDGERQPGEREMSESTEGGPSEFMSSYPTILPYAFGSPIGYELTVVTTRSRTTVNGQVDPW